MHAIHLLGGIQVDQEMVVPDLWEQTSSTSFSAAKKTSQVLHFSPSISAISVQLGRSATNSVTNMSQVRLGKALLSSALLPWKPIIFSTRWH